MPIGPVPQHPRLILRDEVLSIRGPSASQAALELKVARLPLHSILVGGAALVRRHGAAHRQADLDAARDTAGYAAA